MPLPLPNLDTRRWSDLVDEGRAILPRYSREWTDFNIHDPGIMLLELFAWLSEELMYRANRIPDRHLRKFLALCGYPPAPAIPATTVLGVTLAPGAGALALPAGIALEATTASQSVVPFRTVDATTLVEIQLVGLQSFDGSRFRDASRAMRDVLAVDVMGVGPALPTPYDAAHAPAMYLGFDRPLPPASAVQLHLAFADARPGELAQLLAEEAARAAVCAPLPEHCAPCTRPDDPWCTDADGDPGSSGGGTRTNSTMVPVHHSVRTVWEWLANDGWHPFNPSLGEVSDETRGLTLDGGVRLRAPGAMVASAIGMVSTPLYWARCRFLAGTFDALPRLTAIACNAVLVEQARAQWERFVVAAGATITGTPAAGSTTRLGLRIDEAGIVREIEVAATEPNAPSLLLLDYVAPTATSAGSIALPCRLIGSGTGAPEQRETLRSAPIANDSVALWTIEEAGAATRWVSWSAHPDLDAAASTDAWFSAEAVTGAVQFGDGVRGRVPPAGAPMLASYAGTSGVAGNIPAGRPWALVDGPRNRALLGPTFSTLAASSLRNALAARGGADAEDIGAAAARAAADLWAHERLAQLCPSARCSTLDQLERSAVLECVIPERAATTHDIERIALEVPGTRIRRARAWSQLDAVIPCAEASGTVTVVIVPSLPRSKPAPSAGLVGAVKRWLDRRRVLCTRLVVVGPEYLVVSVDATVTASTEADPLRVQADVVAALTTFLDPLVGGPSGFGWPFGRDVYRSEILALVDGVPGVDHVTSLEMSGNGRVAACSNLCVAPTWLVASGVHTIDVVRA
jgi:predicted phage baseplate assembly protein